jgi:hypothetical protein
VAACVDVLLDGRIGMTAILGVYEERIVILFTLFCRGSFRSTEEMEGSGPSDEGSRELGVEGVGEGSTRWRNSRFRKPRNGLANCAEKNIVSCEHRSNEGDAEGPVEVRPQDVDAMDAREVDVGRWSSILNAEAEAEAEADLSVLRSTAETHDIIDGRNAGTEDATEVMEVTGWRNRRPVRRHATRVRSEGIARVGLAALTESSSSDREVHDYSLGLSSDEEDGSVTGKKLAPDIIDLGGDSPLPGSSRGSGFISDGNIPDEEAGLSQSFGQSPLRRLAQRPASADAKRARRIMQSGVAYTEERDKEAEFLTLEDTHDVIESSRDQISVAQSRPESYNLRRVRSLDMAASAPRSRLDGCFFNSNGSHGRLGRARLQAGGSSGVGFSDFNNLRWPFSIPSSSANETTDAQINGVLNLEGPDCPTLVPMRPENTTVVEDDGDSERARQLAEDERVARELQDSFAREDLGVERAPVHF